MAQKLIDYSVLEILTSGHYGEACYKVKHKRTNSLLIWKAYDCKDLTREQLNNISNEVKVISAVKNDHIIKYTETIKHAMSNTLYVVAELYPTQRLSDLITKCKTEHIWFEESFIWSLLYQMASTSKFITTININILQRRLKSSTIFVDPDSQIKVDAFYLKSNQDPSVMKCSSKVCEIGSIIYEACTLQEYSEYNPVSKQFHYSEDLQNIVNILLHDGGRQVCDLNPDILLHHPTVLMNLNPESKQIFADPERVPTPLYNNDSAFESDESMPKLDFTLRKSLSSENGNLRKSLSSDNISFSMSPKSNTVLDSSNILENKSIGGTKSKYELIHNQLSPTLIALDLKIPGYVPSKVSDNVNKWRSRLELCKEPQQVSEEAMSSVWLKRLEALREREEAVKLKEQEIDRNKVFKEVASKICSNLDKNENMMENKSLSTDVNLAKSMSGITLQTAMNQKVFDEDVNDSIPKFKKRLSHSDGSVASNSDKSHISKRSYRRSSSVKTRYRRKKQMSYEDMNSSLSADQGDTSILPTSTKISSNLPRPVSMHNPARRKVHFNSKSNPFAEYDAVSSTTLTFFEIENFDASYEVPKPMPPPQESIADRIAKFTYLDLEAMTNQKRALMEELRKTPPKVNRDIKPTLRSKVKAAENFKKFNANDATHLKERILYTNNFAVPRSLISDTNKAPSICSRMSTTSSQSGSSYRSVSSFTSTKKDERRKTIAPLAIMDIDIEGDQPTSTENKENETTPVPKLKKDFKRRSILGFKTPFKFRL